MHASTKIIQLIWAFEDHVDDSSTMARLKECAEDHEFGTQRSRNIFETIRVKTLNAERNGNTKLVAQWAFEEACAKALFNFGRPAGSYDPDAQFWIFPFAMRLADALGLPEQLILGIGRKD